MHVLHEGRNDTSMHRWIAILGPAIRVSYRDPSISTCIIWWGYHIIMTLHRTMWTPYTPWVFLPQPGMSSHIDLLLGVITQLASIPAGVPTPFPTRCPHSPSHQMSPLPFPAGSTLPYQIVTLSLSIPIWCSSSDSDRILFISTFIFT